jgi:proteasome beta subunit
LTIGHIRQTGTKVQRLNDHAVWAASGEEAVIQRVAERIEAFPQRHQPLLTIRDSLCTMVREAVQQLLALDFRTQFFTGDPKALLDLHPADFLFAEYRDQPRILHVLINGTPEWIAGRPGATGNGAVFAHALLTKYGGTQLICDRAELLCYKVIEEAIQVGAYGLGPPIDIWSIDANGARRAPETHIAALEDAARLLRQRETELLVGGPGQEVPGAVPPVGPDDETVTAVSPATDGGGAHPAG